MSCRMPIVGLLLALTGPLWAQAPVRVVIRAGRLIDGKGDQPLANALIVIERDRIVSVTAGGARRRRVSTCWISHAPLCFLV
jgi:hypothetical protein